MVTEAINTLLEDLRSYGSVAEDNPSRSKDLLTRCPASIINSTQLLQVVGNESDSSSSE